LRPVRDEGVSRRRRPSSTEQRSAGYPSDDIATHMSRRERIALLEREDPAGSQRDTGAQRQEVPGQRETPDSDTAGSLNDQVFEQRRQKRRLRLQQRACERLSRGDGGPPVADSQVGPEVEADRPPRQVCRRRAARNEPDLGAEEAGATPAVSSSALARPLLEELQDVAQAGGEDPRWLEVCGSLSSGAHKLSCSGLVQAIRVLAGAATTPNCWPLAVESLTSAKKAVEAVLVALTPQLGNLGAAVLADAFVAMGASKVQEQTYLDMLLAQLLTLMRKDRASFDAPMVSSIAGSLGALHDASLSAKRAASGPSSAANKRCLDTLSGHIVTTLEELSAADIARIGGAFVVSYMDDTQRRAFLRRAAEMEIGLSPQTQQHILEMQMTEQAVRKASFAFIASLPDLTKDYLMRVKASAKT